MYRTNFDQEGQERPPKSVYYVLVLHYIWLWSEP
jgi:hypothetical protein